MCSFYKVGTKQKVYKERTVILIMLQSDEARNFLYGLFSKIGKADGKYRTTEEESAHLSQFGARKLKRRLLGVCGRNALKTLDEFAEALLDVGIAKSPEEAKELVPKIVQASDHTSGDPNLANLYFCELKRSGGEDVRDSVRVMKWYGND